MKLVLFCIHDSKGKLYGPPFAKAHRGDAERTFAQLTADPQSQIKQFPEDFSLYEVGTFDQNTGKIEAYAEPRHMIKAIDTIPPK